MIVVYPYRHSETDELKYSIRSMVKHFKDMTGVCVIGDCPEWYTGEHIPAKDIPGRKESSIVNKILLAPYENFLLCNDDIYALQDFDDALPLYYSQPLNETIRHGKYAHRVDNTRKLYPSGMMYDIHTPMVVNFRSFHAAHVGCDWGNKEYLCKSIYGNYIGGGEPLRDCKVREGKKIPEGVPFFSTNDRTAGMINLNELYPVKSEYEV